MLLELLFESASFLQTATPQPKKKSKSEKNSRAGLTTQEGKKGKRERTNSFASFWAMCTPMLRVYRITHKQCVRPIQKNPIPKKKISIVTTPKNKEEKKKEKGANVLTKPSRENLTARKTVPPHKIPARGAWLEALRAWREKR